MDTTRQCNNFSPRFPFGKILAAVLVGFFSFSVLIMTADDIGWTCDEVYYFISSELIMEWIQALVNALIHGNPATILSQTITDKYWLWDIKHNPHPPLYKMATGKLASKRPTPGGASRSSRTWTSSGSTWTTCWPRSTCIGLHQLSIWDALVVRAALIAGCRTLYTEDIQHGRRFEGLQIVNPFREAEAPATGATG